MELLIQPASEVPFSFMFEIQSLSGKFVSTVNLVKCHGPENAEIIHNRDHFEALGNTLSSSFRGTGNDAGNAVVFMACLQNFINSTCNLGMFEIARMPHVEREVSGADENGKQSTDKESDGEPSG